MLVKLLLKAVKPTNLWRLMTKEQIIIDAYTRRIEELRIELNTLRRDTRDREYAIKQEVKRLEEQIQNLERMIEDG